MTLELANRLVRFRKESGLSQEEVAEKIGVSRQAVSKWERTEASPDTDNLIALAGLYGVSLDSLVFGSQPAPAEVSAPAKTDPVDDDEDDEDDDDDDEDDDGRWSVRILRVVSACSSILCVIFYLLCGFYGWFHGWSHAWLIFFLIPILESVVSAVRHRDGSDFAYPVLIAAVYLGLGMYFGLWLPGWIIFITVPVYYIVADGLKKRKR